MAEELKDSGAVTAMSVIGLVFGLIGMMGSFIPCLGSFAFFVGIPAAIISAIALGIAYSQKAKKTFAIVAMTISLIGVAVSGFQYFSIIAAGNVAKEELTKQSARVATPDVRVAPETTRKQTDLPAPIAAPTPEAEPGAQVTILKNETSGKNTEAARKIFKETYSKLFLEEDNYNKVINLRNDSNWRTKKITLLKGAENFVKIEGPSYGIVIMLFNKKIKIDKNCNGSYESLKGYPEITGNPEPSFTTLSNDSNVTLCKQILFEPFYRDEKLELLFPAPSQTDYKISLRDAELSN